MDLIPPDVRSALARFPFGSQDGLGDAAKVVVKFFFPAGRYTFYVTEAQADDDDWCFFGYCISPLGEDCDEWGYTALSELQSVHVRGLTIERDLHLPFATRTVGELLRSAA
jgi:Protein of unknown function (DUF2958)